MPPSSPRPLTPAELRARADRIVRLAQEIGFVGRVEYRHVYSQTGGAQYGRAAKPAHDLLTVYAEAFDRDSDADDFSLAAIVAHECGHQLLARHPRLANRVSKQVSVAGEEILASLIGAVICAAETDRNTLVSKAAFDLLSLGVTPDHAARQIQELWELLGEVL